LGLNKEGDKNKPAESAEPDFIKERLEIMTSSLYSKLKRKGIEKLERAVFDVGCNMYDLGLGCLTDLYCKALSLSPITSKEKQFPVCF
jgi:hypothetical protein